MENSYSKMLEMEIDRMSVWRNSYRCISDMKKTKGKENISHFLKDKKIKRIVIYGSGCIGRIFYDVLKEISACEVVGVVDKSHNSEFGFDTFIEIEELKNVGFDICVITPIKAYKKIKTALIENGITSYCGIFEMIDYERRIMADAYGISV